MTAHVGPRRGVLALDQQRHVADHDRVVGRLPIRRSNSSPIAGPGDVAQRLAAVVVGEGDRGQRRPVEAAVGVEDPGPEPLDQRGERRLAGLDHGPRDLVGVDDDRALLPEQLGHGRLPRADPTREPHQQHCDRCYSAKIRALVLKLSTQSVDSSRHGQHRPRSRSGRAQKEGASP